MRKRGKVKLSFITNEKQRKRTFMTRKKGMVKKIHELTTLCGVQACAVIYSPYQSIPEAWPSREGVEEAASKFMEMPKVQTKHMMDQETYLRKTITKEMEKTKKLILENRESQVRQFMFDCVEGKMSEYRYDVMDLHDLKIYIQHYIDQLTRRMEVLTENGESSSFHPFYNADTYANPHVVADPTIVANVTPIGFYNHIQYQNMNHDQKEPVQYHVPTNVFDQIQHGIYNMNLNEDMNLDSNLNLNLNLNQYPNQQETFMNPIVEQHTSHGRQQLQLPPPTNQ